MVRRTRHVLGTHPAGVVREGAVLGILPGEPTAGVGQEGLRSHCTGNQTPVFFGDSCKLKQPIGKRLGMGTARCVATVSKPKEVENPRSEI